MPSIVSFNEYLILWIGLIGCVIYGVIAGIVSYVRSKRRDRGTS